MSETDDAKNLRDIMQKNAPASSGIGAANENVRLRGGPTKDRGVLRQHTSRIIVMRAACGWRMQGIPKDVVVDCTEWRDRSSRRCAQDMRVGEHRRSVGSKGITSAVHSNVGSQKDGALVAQHDAPVTNEVPSKDGVDSLVDHKEGDVVYEGLIKGRDVPGRTVNQKCNVHAPSFSHAGLSARWFSSSFNLIRRA
ncbi:hypothetical protein K438DRAFT_1768323 [Mycena galopus ATCC 62051]|nr:hypothetical protein K438DRAFT_1768323 [Mycena galopus ATCC 62051]